MASHAHGLHDRIDAVPLAPAATGPGREDPVRARLDELLTYAFYSGAGYVFESDPFVVPEDAELLDLFKAVREDDRRHAHVLGTLIAAREGVPQPGVFPWWNLDLNYLTVPCLSRFVIESLEHEVRLYRGLIDAWSNDDPAGKAALEWILADKQGHLGKLRPASAAAVEREAKAYKSAIDALKARRTAKAAKAKAAAEAAKKAKAAAAKPAPAAAPKAAAQAAVLKDPKEPGISSKERGRRTVLKMRAAAGVSAPAPAAAAGAVPPAAAPAPAADLGDPDEPGITPKEKARRKMARLRAAQAPAAPAAPAAAPAAAPVVADLGDPDEPGISPKEKAKRKMARMRAAQAPAAPAATPAAAPPAAPAAAPAPAPVVEDLGDPDEPGISPKEKAKRKVARMRRQAAGG